MTRARQWQYLVRHTSDRSRSRSSRSSNRSYRSYISSTCCAVDPVCYLLDYRLLTRATMISGAPLFSGGSSLYELKTRPS